MLSLLRLFWEICKFKRGPQDVPYSSFLFGALLTIDLILGMLILLIPDYKGHTLPLSIILPYILADAGVTISFVFLVLWGHGHTRRLMQTLCSMLGIDILFGAVHAPISMLAVSAGDQSGILGFFYMATILMLMWQLIINSNIFRHAVSASIFLGGTYAVVLFFLSLYLRSLMLPVPG